MLDAAELVEATARDLRRASGLVGPEYVPSYKVGMLEVAMDRSLSQVIRAIEPISEYCVRMAARDPKMAEELRRETIEMAKKRGISEEELIVGVTKVNNVEELMRTIFGRG